MAIPKTLKIGPYKYKIICNQNEINRCQAEQHSSLSGITFIEQQEIYISPALGIDMEAETLLHEVLHATIAMTSLKLEFEEEEAIVRAISPWLFGIIKDNPELVKYLS